MLRWCFLSFILIAAASGGEPLEEWKPYAKTGLFPEQSAWWLAPNMEKEPIAAFTARMLDGARNADAKAMATLGRFFYVRGDRERAAEWLHKAALAGHAAAQLDYGILRSKEAAQPSD